MPTGQTPTQCHQTVRAPGSPDFHTICCQCLQLFTHRPCLSGLGWLNGWIWLAGAGGCWVRALLAEAILLQTECIWLAERLWLAVFPGDPSNVGGSSEDLGFAQQFRHLHAAMMQRILEDSVQC